MISLRHHAISLAAVFIALAVGVVLGSGLLSDTLLSGLRNEAGSAEADHRAERSAQRAQRETQRGQ